MLHVVVVRIGGAFGSEIIYFTCMMVYIHDVYNSKYFAAFNRIYSLETVCRRRDRGMKVNECCVAVPSLILQ